MYTIFYSITLEMYQSNLQKLLYGVELGLIYFLTYNKVKYINNFTVFLRGSIICRIL